MPKTYSIGEELPAADVNAIVKTAGVYAADAEASDTYVITVTPVPGSYAVGDVFRFKANTKNTGAATLNVNGLGAKTIKKHEDQDLEDGDIVAGQIVTIIYDGTDFQMQGVRHGSALKASFTSDITLAANDSTLTTIISKSISNIKAGDVFRIRCMYDHTLANSANGLNILLVLGSTTIATVTIRQPGTGSLTYTGFVEAYLHITSAAAQEGNVMRTTNLVESNDANIEIVKGTAAEDLTSAKTLALKMQHSDAAASVGASHAFHGFIEKITP